MKLLLGVAVLDGGGGDFPDAGDGIRPRGFSLRGGAGRCLLPGQERRLRPAGLSGQLSVGVAPQTVAQRAGHGVDVLLRVYARFVHDSDEDANRRISEWLRQWG